MVTTSQVAKAIPIIGAIFSFGFRLGSMRKTEPHFPMNPRILERTTETITEHTDGTVTTSRSMEMFSNPPYDVFTSKQYFVDPFANSLSPVLAHLELKLVLASILIPLVSYSIHKYFLKN
jgi:hypothetical protein